jgi:dihydrolipoamide dehydrogenase
MKILTSTKVVKVEKKANSVVCTLEDDKGARQTLEAERMISAVGVVCNTENLGLEKLGVKMDRGAIVTDGLGRTNIPGVYAIGDVAGPPMLAHKAEHEGVLCVEAIKGLHPHAMEKTMIPGCTYCHPQVASVGITEAKAKELGIAVKVGDVGISGVGGFQPAAAALAAEAFDGVAAIDHGDGVERDLAGRRGVARRC